MRIRDHRGKRVHLNSLFGVEPSLPAAIRNEIRTEAAQEMPLPLRCCRWLALLLFLGALDLPRYIVPAILRRGYCPTCGYPLTDRVEEDGCTVCPECGSAWRRHDRTRSSDV